MRLRCRAARAEYLVRLPRFKALWRLMATAGLDQRDQTECFLNDRFSTRAARNKQPAGSSNSA